LRRRLRWRWDLPISRRWAREQIDRCVAALDAPEFALHLDTEKRSVAEIVDDILAVLPKPLPVSLP